jgi:hypothetical protein
MIAPSLLDYKLIIFFIQIIYLHFNHRHQEGKNIKKLIY